MTARAGAAGMAALAGALAGGCGGLAGRATGTCVVGRSYPSPMSEGPHGGELRGPAELRFADEGGGAVRVRVGPTCELRATLVEASGPPWARARRYRIVGGACRWHVPIGVPLVFRPYVETPADRQVSDRPLSEEGYLNVSGLGEVALVSRGYATGGGIGHLRCEAERR